MENKVSVDHCWQDERQQNASNQPVSFDRCVGGRGPHTQHTNDEADGSEHMDIFWQPKASAYPERQETDCP
ncbi:MAG: hypothetical protein DMF21_00705 [Verrucomicrobia bacterium]|nr:MAG: hypothetical protein DMF21_00705 [Verrucomicrobiota bacterium]